MAAKSDRAENQIVAELDQTWAAAVQVYGYLSPSERGELAGGISLGLVAGKRAAEAKLR